MKKIVVVGSMNMDIVTNLAAFPKPGETIHSLAVRYYPGGKGANQAVAAARSGAAVQMIGAVGTDSFGKELIENLTDSGVDTARILQKEGHSGLALISVDQSGENQIILAAGSNTSFSYAEIERRIDWDDAYAILLQNEIAWDTTVAVMQVAKQRGVPVWFNPAPALKLEQTLLSTIHTCILNETEIEVMTGEKVSCQEDAAKAGKRLLDAGVSQVIVTLGDKGCVSIRQGGEPYDVPAFQVKAVDTTAAGDTFIGAYAAAACTGMSVAEALKYATAAAACAVTKEGAQASIPTRQEVEQFIATGVEKRI